MHCFIWYSEYSGTIYSVKREAYRFTSALDWGLDTDGYWPLEITVFRLRISCRYICDVDRFVYIQYVHNIIMWWIDVYNYKQALVRSICEINVNTVNCLMGAIDNVKKCKYLTINFCFYCISIVFKIFLLCLFDKFGFSNCMASCCKFVNRIFILLVESSYTCMVKEFQSKIVWELNADYGGGGGLLHE